MLQNCFSLLLFVCLVCYVYSAEFVPKQHKKVRKECFGTHNGLSRIGNTTQHYNRIRRTFGNCTYVIGNLEITHFYDKNIHYDIDFLSQIEVVTGNVVIALVWNITEIPLFNLRLIKGENNLNFGNRRLGLLIGATSAKELQLPALREISKGDVMLLKNPNLCHTNTIVWEEMTSNYVNLTENGPSNCSECAAECEDRTGRRHCWGAGESMCQTVTGLSCDVMCPGDPKLCHSEGMLGCCHPQCAVGCFGGRDTECLVCRDYEYKGKCLSICPDNTFAYAGYCVDIE